MWYAVSLLYEACSEAKPSVALWQESIRLIEAPSEDDARLLGEEIGRTGEHSYLVDGGKLTWKFRQIQSAYLLEDINLKSGFEVFSRFLRKSEAESLLVPFE